MRSPLRKSENQQKKSVDSGSVQNKTSTLTDNRSEATMQRKLQEKADAFSQSALMPIQRVVSGGVIQRNAAKDKLVETFSKVIATSMKLEREKRGKILNSDLEHFETVTKIARTYKMKAQNIPDNNNAAEIKQIQSDFKEWSEYKGYSAWQYFWPFHEGILNEEKEAAAELAKIAKQKADDQAKEARRHALVQTNDASIRAIRDQVKSWRKQYPNRGGINAGKNSGIGTTRGGSDNPLTLDKGLDSDGFQLTEVASNVTGSDSSTAKVIFSNDIFVHVT